MSSVVPETIEYFEALPMIGNFDRKFQSAATVRGLLHKINQSTMPPQIEISISNQEILALGCCRVLPETDRYCVVKIGRAAIDLADENVKDELL